MMKDFNNSVVKEKPNVMIIVAAATINTGPVKGILQFLRHSDSSKINYCLYNFRLKNDKNADLFMEDTKQIGIKTEFFYQGRCSYGSVIRQAILIVKDRNINIVQTHGFKPTIIGLFLKLICRIKWICFMHGTTNENIKVIIYHYVDNIAQMLADIVILVAEAQRRKIFNGKNKRRVKVIHNAVDIKEPVRFSSPKKHMREMLSIKGDAHVCAFVGRLSPEKGVDVFIDAFKNVLRTMQNCPIHAIIIGDGPERENLECQVKRFGIKNQVHFVGCSSTPGDFMADADMIVLPSRSEGIPNVALEAMALGKPVIATDVGGTPEIIENGKTGIIVQPENPEMLCENIIKLIQNLKLAKRLSEAGLKIVRHYYSPKDRAEAILSIYQELLS